jgi:hypothetical protein
MGFLDNNNADWASGDRAASVAENSARRRAAEAAVWRRDEAAWTNLAADGSSSHGHHALSAAVDAPAPRRGTRAARHWVGPSAGADHEADEML